MRLYNKSKMTETTLQSLAKLEEWPTRLWSKRYDRYSMWTKRLEHRPVITYLKK